MNLLHIDLSIQAEGSASRMISAAIVKRLKAVNPHTQVTYRDLAAEPLPHVTLEALSAVSANAVLAEFLAADIVVIGAPMYNFGIPSQLKAWLDRILIAGHTFSYGADGVTGLAAGKRVIVAHARGGIYAEGSPAAASDHAGQYLRAVLGFIGIDKPHFITAEGLALGAEQREAALARALAEVGEDRVDGTGIRSLSDNAGTSHAGCRRQMRPSLPAPAQRGTLPDWANGRRGSSRCPLSD